MAHRRFPVLQIDRFGRLKTKGVTLQNNHLVKLMVDFTGHPSNYFEVNLHGAFRRPRKPGGGSAGVGGP